MEWGMVTGVVVCWKLVWSAVAWHVSTYQSIASYNSKETLCLGRTLASPLRFPPNWRWRQFRVRFRSRFSGLYALKQCWCDLVQLVQQTVVKLAIFYLAPCNWVLLMLDWCSCICRVVYKPRVPECSQKWHWENGRNMVERHKSWFTAVFDVSLGWEWGRLGSTLIICHLGGRDLTLAN